MERHDEFYQIPIVNLNKKRDSFFIGARQCLFTVPVNTQKTLTD